MGGQVYRHPTGLRVRYLNFVVDLSLLIRLVFLVNRNKNLLSGRVSGVQAQTCQFIPIFAWFQLTWSETVLIRHSMLLCALVLSLANAYAMVPPKIVIMALSDDQGWFNVQWHNPETLMPFTSALLQEGVELQNHLTY